MLFCKSSTVNVGTIALICTTSCVVATITSFCFVVFVHLQASGPCPDLQARPLRRLPLPGDSPCTTLGNRGFEREITCASAAARSAWDLCAQPWSVGPGHAPSTAHIDRSTAMASAQKVVELSRENTPLFRDLHKLFDRIANDVLPTLDELAERVRMIGQDPPGYLLEAADLASVGVGAPHATMREMVEEADRHLLVVISEMRRAAKVADQHGDPGTVDLFSRFVQIHEKHE